MKKLLSREDFKNAVLKRDGYKCVVCKNGIVPLEAHHIIERKLWTAAEEEGGYFLSNGATVCNNCHQYAERNLIPPQAFWRLLGQSLSEAIVPRQLNHIKHIDKWGKILVTPPSDRTFIKYPSTKYFASSPSAEDILTEGELSHLISAPIVVTTKMDGSNVQLTSEYVASRAGWDGSAIHPSFNMLKAKFHAEYKYLIPKHIQLFGEWLFAKHSIHYVGDLGLKSYLQLFSAYDTRYALFLGWEEVMEYASLLGVPTVPHVVSYELAPNSSLRYKYENIIGSQAEYQISEGHEGVVVRSMLPFHYGQFSSSVAKYVRANHVQTDVHWTHQEIIRNEANNNKT